MPSSEYPTSRSSNILGLFIWPTFIIIFTYMTAYLLMRPLGAVPLIIVACLAAPFVAFSSKTINQPFFLALTAFSILILLLSLAHVMPAGWTRYWEFSAAFRHWVWVPLLLSFMAYFETLFRLKWNVISKYSFHLLIIAILLSRFARYFTPVRLEEGARLPLYGLSNDTIIIFVLVCLWIYVRRPKSGWQMAALLALLAASTSSQTVVSSLLLIAIWALPYPALIARAFGVALFTILFVAPHFALELRAVDENTAVRAVFWNDTILAVKQTFGMGVGYGTEYVTNNFAQIGVLRWGLAGAAEEGRLFLGTHSAFYDVLIRLGIIGGMFFLFWILTFFPPHTKRNDANMKLRCSILVLFLLSGMFNPGLVSINFLLGNAMCLGLLLHLRWFPLAERQRFGQPPAKTEVFMQPSPRGS